MIFYFKRNRVDFLKPCDEKANIEKENMMPYHLTYLELELYYHNISKVSNSENCQSNLPLTCLYAQNCPQNEGLMHILNMPKGRCKETEIGM